MYISLDASLAKEISESHYNYISEILVNGQRMFGPLNKVNIFIGANNSGKSRFMRGLLKSNDLKGFEEKEYFVELDKLTASVKTLIEALGENKYISINIPKEAHYKGGSGNIHRVTAIYECLNNNKGKKISLSKESLNDFLSSLSTKELKAEDFGVNKNNIQSKVSELALFDALFAHLDTYLQEIITWYNADISRSNIEPRDGSIRQKLNAIVEQGRYIVSFQLKLPLPSKKTYVPILRSAGSLFNETGNKVHENILKKTVSTNYDFQNTKIDIQCGDDLYERIRELRNDVYSVRKNFEEFETFLSSNFYQGKKVDIVARHKKNTLEDNIIVNIGGHEHPIHHLGDGIQALIIIMYSIFNAPKNSWIFIEEPEVNLHPGFQRIFMDTVLNNDFLRENNITLFFTTHSNHLIDVSLEMEKEISIFSFDKVNKAGGQSFEIKNTKRSDGEILSKLGVTNGSVLMANSAIWIEGISDRIYLRSFLKAYYQYNPKAIKYKEDLHFCFFEYAGSNLAHYIFNAESLELEEKNELEKINSQYLSNKIWLLADKDRNKEKKHLDFVSSQNSKFKYEFLKVRELENLLSPLQIKKIVAELFRSIDSQKLESVPFKQEDYKEQYLGDFLVKLVKDNKAGHLPKLFCAESGTVNTPYKIKIANKLSENVRWEDMSSEAQRITEMLYNFIKESNANHFLS